jgi:hypothetical protein
MFGFLGVLAFVGLVAVVEVAADGAEQLAESAASNTWGYVVAVLLSTIAAVGGVMAARAARGTSANVVAQADGLHLDHRAMREVVDAMRDDIADIKQTAHATNQDAAAQRQAIHDVTRMLTEHLLHWDGETERRHKR